MDEPDTELWRSMACPKVNLDRRGYIGSGCQGTREEYICMSAAIENKPDEAAMSRQCYCARVNG